MSVRDIWEITRDAASEWMEDSAPRLSAALAFYTILSIAPLFVIVIAVAGFVFGEEAATGELSNQLKSLMGDAGAEVVKTTVQNADRPKAGIFATVVGVVTLLFGASGVFGELQSALNTVWDVKPKEGRGIWGTIRDRFLSFAMVFVLAFLLLVSLVISTALTVVGSFMEGLLPASPVILHVINFIVSFGVISTLFAAMFKFLPDVKLAWRDVWGGALVTAALFTVGKYLISLYLGQGGVTSAFGAAGSVVAFVVWVYYSGSILFFGAEITQVRLRRLGRTIEPTENAEPIDHANGAVVGARA